jgi:SAM-dependent methyltransferase
VSDGEQSVAVNKAPGVYAVYNDRPSEVAPDDYWGQVRRSVHGKPVDDDQIRLIVDAVREGLALTPNDVLLDLCCGNGALVDRIFEYCSGGLGVDFAENQIAVARTNFERPPQRRFIVDDVVGFVTASGEADRFTKALCYGSFAYIPADDAATLLRQLRQRFRNVERVFIGNLPDKASAVSFFGAEYVAGIEDDHDSAIGLWRSEDEFRALAAATGWHVAFHRMPAEYYSARYRYDAVLTPA